MALSLKYNGTTTTTIPGSPSNGDAITMDNGVLRVTFTYGDHIASLWIIDNFEVWDGAAWQRAYYGRDRLRLVVGGTEKTGSDALSIVTNTASVLTLKTAWSSTVAQGGVNWSASATFTMRTAHNFVEYVPAFSGDGNFTGNIDFYGAGYMSAGKQSDILKQFQYATTIGYSTNYSLQTLIRENKLNLGRSFAKPNTSATITSNYHRGYGNGGAFIRQANSVSFMVYYDPTSYQTLLETTGGYTDYIWANGGYQNWWPGIDNKYQSNHDNGIFAIAPGVGATNPTANTVYSCKVWLNAEVLSSTADDYFVREWNAFAFSAQGKMTAAAQAVTLAQLDGVLTPTMASTYTTYFDTTYGFQIYIGDTNQHVSFGNGLAIMACLRLYRYTGTADYLTNATRIKNILLTSWQNGSGATSGAFYKLYNTSAAAYRCQEGNHAANSDQPHIALYTHVEICQALLEYYKVTGDTGVRTALDNAANFLLNAQNTTGYFNAEVNSSGVPTTQNPNGGQNQAGSPTVACGAFLLEWGITHTANANATKWQKAGYKALNYWSEFEPDPHGAYEYGEGQNTYSSHSLRMTIGGFAKAFRLTGNQKYLTSQMYFMEMAIAQFKKVDVVLNNSSTANKDIHTGGLPCTIDWAGQVAGEAMSIIATMLTEGLRNHTDIRKHILFYLWVYLQHFTYGMRDQNTYTQPSAFGYSYISPGTNWSAATSIDNTRMCFHAPSLGLLMTPIYYLIKCDNTNILATCLEGDTVVPIGDKRTIVVYNPQATTQTANITIGQLANLNRAVTCTTNGVVGTPSSSAGNLIVPITLTTDQIATIKI